ncbi:MAG: hypothetical protein R6W73_06180 [Candidatus Saliniplasma sp.]
MLWLVDNVEKSEGEDEGKGLTAISEHLETDDVMKKYIIEIIKEEIEDKAIKKMNIGDEDSLEDVKKAVSLYIEAKIKEYSAYSLLLKSGSGLALKILLSRLKNK